MSGQFFFGYSVSFRLSNVNRRIYLHDKIKIPFFINSDDLKKIQSPLKEKYKENPESALITLRAEGKLDEGISCKVETGHALIAAGLHPATGGTGLLACSGDLLLQALVACAGVTLN